jgi:hypothetical protein
MNERRATMKGTGFIVAVILGLLLVCSSLGYAATIQGAVTEAGGSPISGATVKYQNVRSYSVHTVKTQGDGSYSLTVPSGTYVVSAYDNSHYPKTHRNVGVAESETVTKSFALVPIGSQTGTFDDDFSSGDLSAYDTTTGINGQSVFSTGGTFTQQGQVGFGDGIVAIIGFQPTDFELTADIARGAPGGFIGFCYRQKEVRNPGYGNGGYGFFVNPDGTIRIFGHGTNWGNFADFDWDQFHQVKIRVTGNRHQVWVDGAKLIDFIDWSTQANNAPGHIYTYVQDTTMVMDNLHIVKFDAPVGTVTGTISKEGAPQVKIQGATVSVDGYSVFTGVDGVYSVSVPATEIYSVTATAPQYLSTVVDGVQVVPGGTTTADLALPKPEAYNNPPSVSDSFSRYTLGKTEGGGYNWIASNEYITVDGTRAYMSFGGKLAIGPDDSGALFLPKDFDLTFSLQYTKDFSAGEQFSICWRQGSTGPGAENGGYRIAVGADGGILIGRAGLGNTVYAGATPTDHWNPHTYRIMAIGNTHKVWIDGVLVADYTDRSKTPVNVGGYIYFSSEDGSGYGREMYIDDVICYDLTTSTGVITGTILSGTTPLSGADVKLNGGLTVTTGPNGVYRFERLPSGTYDISVSCAGYYGRTVSKINLVDGTVVTQDISLNSAAPSVVDTFGNPPRDGAALGVTEDANHWNWIKGKEDQQILNGQLVLPTGGSATIGPKDGGIEFQPSDFDLTVKLVSVAAGGYGNIAYRDGWGLWMLRPENAVTIYNSLVGRLNTVSLGSSFNWDAPHVIRLKVFGDRHQVWVDGSQVMDVRNSSYPTGRRISLWNASPVLTIWDDLSIVTYGDAVISGTVTEDGNPAHKIAGATVKVGSYSTTTASDGTYSVTVLADGTTSLEVSATADRYYESDTVSVTPSPGDTIAGVDLEMASLPIKSGADLDAKDTFTRPNSSDPGVTEDSNHWSWLTNPTGAAVIDGEALFMSNGGNAGPFKTASDDSVLQVDDFEASILVSGNTNADPVGLCYRQRNFNPGYENSGYAVVIRDGHKWFYYSTRSLSNPWVIDRHVLDLGPIAVDWNADHILRVRAVGKRHQAWLDGQSIVDWYDTSVVPGTASGFLYLAQSNASQTLKWDNLNVGRRSLITGPGTITGVVYEAGNPSRKFAGALVNVGGATRTTDSNGVYSVTVDAYGGSYTVQATYGEDYSGSTTVTPVPGGTVTADVALSTSIPRATVEDVLDTFSRPDSPDPGQTEDANHWSWFQVPGVTPPAVSGGRFYLAQGGNVGPWKRADETEFKPADFEASFDVLNMNSSNFAFGYRQSGYSGQGYANGGYLAFVFSSGMISLFRGMPGNWEHIWQPSIPTPNWALWHKMRVRVFGNRHQAWLDDQKIIDYTDNAANAVNTGGYLYFTSSDVPGGQFKIDNFRVADGKLLPLVTSVAVSGTVTDAASPSTKIADALVLIGSKSTTTNANGYYSVGGLTAGNTYQIQVMADGYLRETVSVTPTADETVNIALSKVPVSTVPDVLDTFNREGPALGVTEDSNHWSWFSSGAGVAVAGNQLVMPNGGTAGPDKKLDNTEFRPADFDLTVTLVDLTNYAAIGYRADGYAGTPYALGGYTAWIRRDNNTAYIYSTWSGVFGATALNSPDWSKPHQVRVRVFGARHRVWFDGQLIIDTVDPSGSPKFAGGYLYLTDGVAAYPAVWDNLKIAVNAYLAEQASSVADAKSKADGTLVQLSNVEVTRAFGGFFYVEDNSRASGIRVDSPAVVATGGRVTVAGTVATEGNERKIVAYAVNVVSGQPTIRPLGMTNASVQPNIGTSTVGLLVTVWGKVKSSGPGYIMISDGAAGSDLRINLDFDHSGYTYPNDTKYLLVTGVHGATSGAVIHVDKADDIRVLDGAP